MRLRFLHTRTRPPTTSSTSNFDELLEFRIGDVRDYETRGRAPSRDADVVFHAAALKQVPTCEYFPVEAVAHERASAPQNLVRARAPPERTSTRVIGISTDKACKPINVMGMTKAIQERILVEANLAPAGDAASPASATATSLASRGSVIPLFREQIARGGPVTITLPEMTRFLLSLDGAVDTIFAASARPGPARSSCRRCRAARIPTSPPS